MKSFTMFIIMVTVTALNVGGVYSADATSDTIKAMIAMPETLEVHGSLES